MICLLIQLQTDGGELSFFFFFFFPGCVSLPSDLIERFPSQLNGGNLGCV